MLADSPQCPVCKAGVDKAKVIPIYGRGRSEADDPRHRPLAEDDEAVPPRPSGHRAPPLRQRIHPNTPFGVHHTFGINTYPAGNYEFSFSNFGLFPNIFGQVPYPPINEPPVDEPNEQQEEGIPEGGKSFHILYFLLLLPFLCSLIILTMPENLSLCFALFSVTCFAFVNCDCQAVAKVFLLLSIFIIIIITTF